MATVNPQQPSVWLSKFEAEEREQMIGDDLFAGRSVSLVLVSVVAVGLLIMIGTVLFTL